MEILDSLFAYMFNLVVSWFQESSLFENHCVNGTAPFHKNHKLTAFTLCRDLWLFTRALSQILDGWDRGMSSCFSH